jgi:uncharacterized protein YicC (UPF0701 family)
MARAAVSVDIRSVNGRFLDLALRLPDELRGLEPALRELVGGALKRGKVELRLNTQRDSRRRLAAADARAAEPAVAAGRRTVTGLAAQGAPLSVHEALQWCRGGAPASGWTRPRWPPQAAVAACARPAPAKAQRLANMLRSASPTCASLAARAAPLVPAVVQRQQQRFLERWNEALAAGRRRRQRARRGAAGTRAERGRGLCDPHRRGRGTGAPGAHLDEIERLLAKAGGELGKRLDFLIQELHREANTLGSKSRHWN